LSKKQMLIRRKKQSQKKITGTGKLSHLTTWSCPCSIHLPYDHFQLLGLGGQKLRLNGNRVTTTTKAMTIIKVNRVTEWIKLWLS
jgi:hypothetical protein